VPLPVADGLAPVPPDAGEFDVRSSSGGGLFGSWFVFAMGMRKICAKLVTHSIRSSIK
jgi:hypothetical protein